VVGLRKTTENLSQFRKTWDRNLKPGIHSMAKGGYEAQAGNKNQTQGH